MAFRLDDSDFLEICRGCGIRLEGARALCATCTRELGVRLDREAADRAAARAVLEARIDRELGITGPWTAS